MGRGSVIAVSLLCVINQTPYPRVLTALVAAMLAVLIDLMFRFSAYRDLLHSLSVAGIIKSLGAFTLVFLQVVALFYLFTLLPGPLRVVVLLFSVFIIIIQCSYWLTLSQFMTGTDLFLALTVSGEHRVEAILSFFNPLVILYALPYELVLSLMNFAPPVSAIRETLALSLLSALYLVASNYALFLYVPELSFHLNPLTSFLRSALSCKFENLRKYRGPRDELPAFQATQRALDNIIYVIDESVRGSNLSLNGYPRATTPFLEGSSRTSVFVWRPLHLPTSAMRICLPVTTHFLTTTFEPRRILPFFITQRKWATKRSTLTSIEFTFLRSLKRPRIVA